MCIAAGYTMLDREGFLNLNLVMSFFTSVSLCSLLVMVAVVSAVGGGADDE